MAKILKNIIISKEVTNIGRDLSEPRPSGSGTLTGVPLPDGRGSENRSSDRFDENQREIAYAQGLTDGMAQERTNQTSTLNTLLQSIPAAINENRKQLSSEITDIVLLIASKFFITQQQNKDAITYQINQIINQLNEKQTIEIALHPHDLALIQKGEIKLDVRTYKHLRFIPDDSLRLGGCIVNSEHGVFDAGIERQIDNLKEVLLRMRSNS